MQGLVICGACGERMSVRYHSHRNAAIPTYWCGRRPLHRGEIGLCQTVHGAALDAAIGDIIIEAMTPLSIEVALNVQQELANRPEEADRLRRQHVERAKYEAELAQRRYLKVDPDNRLVADALEADWNAKLRALAAAQEAYEKASAAEHRVRCRTCGADDARHRLPSALVRSAHADEGKEAHAAPPDRGRDPNKWRYGTYGIRFVGGATRALDLPLPKSCVELRTTDAAVVEEIDRLIDTYTDKEIADLLNERGVRTIVTTPWTPARIGRLRHIYRLTDRRTRLLAQGLLSPEDVATRYGVAVSTVHIWRRRGLLRAHPVNDRGDFLHEIPPEDLPARHAHKRDYQVDPVTSSSHN